MPNKSLSKNKRLHDCQLLPNLGGYRLPAEWEAHESTWLAWPHRQADWPGKFQTIPWVYGEIIRWLHLHEMVNILVNDAASEKKAIQLLTKLAVDFSRIQFWRYTTDRVWTRDYGPMFLIGPDRNKGIVDWQFNAWAKYPDWKKDAAIAGKIGAARDHSVWRPTYNDRRIVLEAGSIDTNGNRLLMTTEECLLSDIQARNPGLGKEDLERIFSDYLGVKKVLWLGKGIAGDDTHGHVDDLARFVGVRTVVTVVATNQEDENYEPLQENLALLSEMTDLEGRALEVVPLPMPAPLYFNGQRLPASYANFYIANGLVLVPTFNDPNDRIALGILSDLFPGRKVVGIHAVDLVWGLGTLHCMTLHEPAIVEANDERNS